MDNNITGMQRIDIAQIVGAGYGDFWRFKGRYRVVKGSRGSKKSCTTSLQYILKMMEYYYLYGLKPNLLVIRKYYALHKESTFAQLRWAINRLGVADQWKANISPLSLTFRPSGQQIIFRGMDDPDSITSITVADGYLCWVWWEEAYQIGNEKAFDKVDLSIRGDVPYPLYKQHTLIFNPWSERTWIKRRFFDAPADEDVFTKTTTYLCNEFLGADDLKIFNDMKLRNPKRYLVEGEGNWGIAKGLIFENVVEMDFNWRQMALATNNGDKKFKPLFGLDFGYSIDPTAFIGLLVDTKAREIYIFDEIYKTQMTNKEIYDAIAYKGYGNQLIKADSEDPRTINELRILGLSRITKASKPPGSVNAGIQKLQDYKIFVHPSCVNTMAEFENYTWAEDKQTGEALNKPIDDFNHLMDALRYATEDITIAKFSW
jgi:phage terminase large subunit